jgi:hypothetical protein
LGIFFLAFSLIDFYTIALYLERFTMSESEKHGLLVSFVRDVYQRAEEVDPGDMQDWFSLSLGYFLGKGANVEVAYELAMDVRYHGALDTLVSV